MHRSDAEAAIKKFKKTLSAVVAATILKSFDGKRDCEDGGMDYDAFCDLMNGLSVREGRKDEPDSTNKDGAEAGKRQRKPSKKRKS